MVESVFLSERLRSLSQHMEPGSGECPFVVDAAAAGHVILRHFSAGPDVRYIVVQRRQATGPVGDLSVNVDFAPSIEGTALIYDATAEMLQGKARPFVCHLREVPERVYAILPFQIEGSAVRKHSAEKQWELHISFLHGSGETIRGALPFELRAPAAVVKSQILSTARKGVCVTRLPDDRAPSLSGLHVRSLLTGVEYSI